MPKIIDPSVKSQIIKMHLGGKGRNEIARDLKKHGVDVSSGTVSGLLKQYREQPESSNKSDIRVTPFPEENLAETEFKNNKSISIENHVITNTQDFEENGYPVGVGQNRKGGPLSFWFTNGYETKSAVNNMSEVTKEDEKLEGGNNSLHTPSMGLSPTSTAPLGQPSTTTKDSTSKAETVPKKIYRREPKFIEDRFDIERRAWDYYGFAWTRILEQIKHEKYQRKHELFVIDRRKQKLVEWKAKLDSREARILEAEPFLDVAKQLQNLGIGMDEALPYFENIRERAEAERIDHKTSAAQIAQELRQSGAIQKQIERANQELALINMATIKRQQAITVVEDLINNKGITQSQILQLINFAGEWSKYWETNANLQQSGSSNPGSNGNNGPSMNDLIRLNLLSANTTRQLNRMGAN